MEGDEKGKGENLGGTPNTKGLLNKTHGSLFFIFLYKYFLYFYIII